MTRGLKENTHKNKILLLGSTGQIGKTLLKKYKKKIKFIVLKKNQINFLKKNFEKRIYKEKPRIIINLAAYTDVDGAEKERKNSKQINYISVKKIVDVCKKLNATLVHISTDYIFKSVNKKLLKENFKKNPVNFYGYTKLMSEKYIVKSNISYVILRTSWVFSEYNSNFVKKIISISKKNNCISVVSDEFSKPTSANLLATVIYKVLNKIISNKEKIQKIYNIANKAVASRYTFARHILQNYFKDKKKRPILKKISSKSFTTLAKRPFYSALSTSKFESDYDLKINHWKKDLKMVIKQLKS